MPTKIYKLGVIANILIRSAGGTVAVQHLPISVASITLIATRHHGRGVGAHIAV